MVPVIHSPLVQTLPCPFVQVLEEVFHSWLRHDNFRGWVFSSHWAEGLLAPTRLHELHTDDLARELGEQEAVPKHAVVVAPHITDYYLHIASFHCSFYIIIVLLHFHSLRLFTYQLSLHF